eukprot:scaffold78655_cov35-Attheya_sp.AAC.1
MSKETKEGQHGGARSESTPKLVFRNPSSFYAHFDPPSSMTMDTAPDEDRAVEYSGTSYPISTSNNPEVNNTEMSAGP